MCIKSTDRKSIEEEDFEPATIERINEKTRERESSSGGLTGGGGGMGALADCFSEVFQGADLVPSDISAGLALLAIRDRRILRDEPLGVLLKPCVTTTNGKGSSRSSSNDIESGGGNDDSDIEKALLTATNDSPRSSRGNVSPSPTREHDVMLASGEMLSKTLEDMAHYARWSLAAYGWTLYAWAYPSKGFKMAFSLKGMSKMCCGSYYRKQKRKQQRGNSNNNNNNNNNNVTTPPSEEAENIVVDMQDYDDDENERLFNSRQDVSLDRSALKACAGISSRDIFYISKEEGVGKAPYFIARDVLKRTVVVSIRGTLSVADCVTDAMYKPIELSTQMLGKELAAKFKGAQLNCHKGIADVAEFIFNDLNRHRILDQVILGAEGTAEGSSIADDVKRECLGWNLVLTGHSLGGATASVVGLFLREKFPDLKAIAIEPPGGLLSLELAKETEAFCTSCVHGIDAIARLSGPALLKLRSEVINALVRCKLSKTQLITKLAMSRTELVEADVFNSENDELPSEATALRRSFTLFAERQILDNPNIAFPLYPPGEILHLRKVNVRKSKAKLLKRTNHINYEVWKVEAKDLMDRGIVVGPSFFVDHFPDTAAMVLSILAASYYAVPIETASFDGDDDDDATTVRRGYDGNSNQIKLREDVMKRMNLPRSASKIDVPNALDNLVSERR